MGNRPQPPVGGKLPPPRELFHVRDLRRQLDHSGERPGHLAPDLRFVRVGELALVHEHLDGSESTCERERTTDRLRTREFPRIKMALHPIDGLQEGRCPVRWVHLEQDAAVIIQP
ncbi:MAG: hypothetical protein M3324_09920 [Actinomycetota bacterium]|nr:hypothetical protein [Actinomycetota bacterium]